MDVSAQSLMEIQRNAATLWERLESSPGPHEKRADVEALIERWRVELGDNSKLQRRLQWLGSDEGQLRSSLGGDLSPQGWAWIDRLRDMLRGYRAMPPDPSLPTQDRLPFEDVLRPLVAYASGRVQGPPQGPLEQALLRRLTELCAPALNVEFAQVRLQHQSALELLIQKINQDCGDKLYRRAVAYLHQGGLEEFYCKYSVLARQTVAVVEGWISSSTELLRALEQDAELLQQVFPGLLYPVVKVEPLASDTHRNGRAVYLVYFQNGYKLVYKPRTLGLEAAFGDFLEDLHGQGFLPRLLAPKCLDRGTHGWMEHVEARPCVDAEGGRRFFLRAGALACLLYVLGGTDCHHENIVAHGDYPVAVDLETLLHAKLAGHDERGEIAKLLHTPLSESVLRSFFLPHSLIWGDGESFYDLSGLGHRGVGLRYKRRVWKFVNSDVMCTEEQTVELETRAQAHLSQGQVLLAQDFAAEIRAGFCQAYQFLSSHKQWLVEAGGPLQRFAGLSTRFVFRPTQIYGNVRSHAQEPGFLGNGALHSVALEGLAREFLSSAEDAPPHLAMLTAELSDMENLDVPYFTATTTGSDLTHPSVTNIFDCLQENGYARAQACVGSLDSADLGRQLAILESSFYPNQAASSPPGSAISWVEEARRIGAELRARAVLLEDGRVTWVGHIFHPHSHKAECKFLSHGLYEGSCGVMVYLAALAATVQDEELAAFVVTAAQARFRVLRGLSDEGFQWLRSQGGGIGGATGLGSLMYTAAKLSQLLQDSAFVEQGLFFASLLRPQDLAEGGPGVCDGLAGALLGLTSLYRVAPVDLLLGHAVQCGDELLRRRVPSASGPRAWITGEKQMLTGFSLGAAGVAYSLIRLFRITGNSGYLEAAQEAQEFENSKFCALRQDWPDLPLSSARTGVWCHCAPGIALARLGGESLMTDDLLGGLNSLPRVEDHLCCGNFARVELLAYAGRCLGRPDLGQAAKDLATLLVARAQPTGSYQLSPVASFNAYHPGFFQGTAGIGYTLLRLAYPDRLPCVLLWE